MRRRRSDLIITPGKIVITGLAPVIHHLFKNAYDEERWIAGSSPAMTSGDGAH